MADAQEFDDAEIFAAAAWMGLGRAVELMPEDVREAYANARRTAAALPRLVDNGIDPWAPEVKP